MSAQTVVSESTAYRLLIKHGPALARERSFTARAAQISNDKIFDCLLCESGIACPDLGSELIA